MFKKNLLEKNKVTFISDDTLKTSFARNFYKIETFDMKVLSNEININEIVKDIKMKMTDAPDITFTNPPYTNNLDLKLLLSLKEHNLLKKIICVHPTTWLVDNKNMNKLYKNFKEEFEKIISDIDIFNGNHVFGIKLWVPCAIVTADFNEIVKTTRINWFNKLKWEVHCFNNITIHGKMWDPIVKDFQSKVINHCLKYGSIHSHLKNWSECDINKRHIQLAKIRGHVVYNDIEKIFENDFYTFVQFDSEKNKGIRIRRGGKTVLEINLEKEQNNLLEYLKTDFARLCLSLLKINQHLDVNETKFVPWIDFTRSWTDDELFSEFGYYKGHTIREYTKDFLPDYHNLYPHGKTY